MKYLFLTFDIEEFLLSKKKNNQILPSKEGLKKIISGGVIGPENNDIIRK